MELVLCLVASAGRTALGIWWDLCEIERTRAHLQKSGVWRIARPKSCTASETADRTPSNTVTGDTQVRSQSSAQVGRQALLVSSGKDNIVHAIHALVILCCSSLLCSCEWQRCCWMQAHGRGGARMKRYKVPDHFRRGLRQAIGVGTAVFVGYLLLHGDRLLALHLPMHAGVPATALVCLFGLFARVCTMLLAILLIHTVPRYASLCSTVLVLCANGRCQGAVCQAVAARRQVGGHHNRCRGQPCSGQGHTGARLYNLGK